MNYGLYLSASGVLTSMYRQDVFANNLANAQTAGYRSDLPGVRQRLPESAESAGGAEFRHSLLDKLGGGVWAGPQQICLEPGAISPTGRDLDMALADRNAFFAVGVKDGQTGGQQVRLTRDGRFNVDATGKLVTAAGGHAVLDPQDRPITVRTDAPVSFTRTGGVKQNGQIVGQVQIVAATDPSRLVKEGQNLLRALGGEGGSGRRTLSEASVQPGYLEGSDVDPIRTLMNLVAATKDASSNANLIRYHDLLMERAVNTLGRVA